MFDNDRLFRVMYYLVKEPKDFLVAQDALITLRSCINQIENVDFFLNDMIARRDRLGSEFIESYRQHQTCVEKLECLQRRRQELLDLLIPLRTQAGWYLCSYIYKDTF